VCRTRVEEVDKADAVDFNRKLHGARRKGLYASQRMQRYRGRLIWTVHIVIIIQDFDNKQMLTHLFMPLRKQIITMETLSVLRRSAISAGDSFLIAGGYDKKIYPCTKLVAMLYL
jgi:hypothetical protein